MMKTKKWLYTLLIHDLTFFYVINIIFDVMMPSPERAPCVKIIQALKN